MLGSGKLYFFSDSEKKELIKIGLSHCQGLGFKSCIVSGKLYSTIYNSTKNRANYIIKSNNQYFIVEKIIYLDDQQFSIFLTKKCTTSEGKYSVKSVNVVRISKKTKIVLSNNLEIYLYV